MLDIKYIRDNKEKIEKVIKNKGLKLDLDELLANDDKRKDIITRTDELRAKRNELAQAGKNSKPTPDQIKKGKKIKKDLATIEKEMEVVENKHNELMSQVPNIVSNDTPIGKTEEDNKEIFKWGKPTKFDFEPRDHVWLGRNLDLIDFDRGAKVAGYRGYYLKNEAVLMQLGLMMMALDKLITKGFKPMIPPTLVKEFALFGSGYFAGSTYNSDIDEIYKIANENKDKQGKNIKESKFLVGTAEPSLLAYYSGEVLKKQSLPIKLCGFSQCYRSEIGSYGKDTKGIYRVHEFMKIEQVAICQADLETAEKLHQEMLDISKELHEDLGLPYRILSICTGDMGLGKYKMHDIEAWIPSRKAYGETGSASNFLDWQSRRLNVKYETGEGDKKFVYMLNNTALASARPLIAILENYQQKDGSIKIPEKLQKYIPGNLKKIT